MKKIALLFLIVLAISFASAQTLYWSGSKTWLATNANWGLVSGGPYTHLWVSGDTANFAGTAGTITLGANITITAAASDFTINADTLTENGADTLRSPIALSANAALLLIPNYAANPFTQSGNISGGTGSKLILSGITLLASKTVRVNMFGPNTSISVPTTINLVGSNGNTDMVGVIGEASGTSISGTVTLNGTVGGGRAMFAALAGDTLNLSGQVTGTGDIQFSVGTNGGTGTLALSNTANNFTGNLYMVAGSNGTVEASSGGTTCIPSTMGLYYPASGYGGVFDIYGANVTIAALSSEDGALGGVTNNGTSSTLTVNQSINTSFNQIISNGSPTQKLALTKSGTGSLTLTGVNTYTGATTVSAGSLFIDTGSLAAASAVTVASGAVFGGNTTAKGTLALSGTLSPGLTGSGSAGTFTTGVQTWLTGAIYQCDILAATGSPGTNWDLDSSTAAINFSAGGYTININGSGITGFSNTGSYSWEIISASTFTSYSASAFTLNITGFPAYTGTFSLLRSGPTVSLVYTPLPVAPVTQATNVTFSPISNFNFGVNWTNGNGASRIVVIRLASTTAVPPVYGTTYAASTVYGTDSTGLGNYVIYNGTGSGPITVTGLTANTAYTVEVYEYNGGTGQQAYNTTAATGNPASTSTIISVYYWNGASAATGTNVTANGGTGTWSVANSWVEPTNPGTGATWADGGIAIVGGTLGKITINQNQTVDSMQVNTTGYTFTQSGATTFTGPINLASGVNLSIVPNITSIFTYAGNITGDNTTGLTFSGSTLAANKVSRINLTQPYSVISTPVTIDLNTINTTLVGFAGDASGINMSGNIALNGTAGGGRAMFCAFSGDTLNLSGQVTGTADIQFSLGLSPGSGTVVFSNPANSFTGNIYLQGYAAGTIKATYGSTSCIPSTTGVYYPASGTGGVFDINGANVTIAALSSVDGVIGGVTNNGNSATLTVNQSSNTSFSLVLSNGGSTQKLALTKSGSGTLTLTGVNTYTGATTVSAGSLFIDTGSLAAGSAVTVAGGAVFGGNTTAKGTLALSGTLSPGLTGRGSAGTFTTGAQTWSTGAIYQCDILAATGSPGTNWDLDSSNGAINFAAGGYTINVNGSGITGFSNTGSYSWEIISASTFTSYSASAFTLNITGFPAYTGTFSLLRSGPAVSLVYTPLPVAPVTQATNVNFSSISNFNFNVNWTNGNGASRIAVARLAPAIAVPPVYGTTYAASTVYGTDSTGTGNYVIYNGTGTGPVTVTGLAANTTYTVEVYEYNGGAGQQAYNTSSATGNPNSATTLISVYYWNGGNPTPGTNVTANGGTAQWQVTNAWVEPTNPGTGATWQDGGIAILGGTAGKVTLTQNQTVDSMQVNTTGYTFTHNAANTFTGPVNLASGVTLNMVPNITTTFTYAGNITGDSTTGISINSSNLAANTVSKIALAQDSSVITVPITVILSSNDSTYAGFVSTGSDVIISGPINLNTPGGGGRTILAATNGNSLRVSGQISGTGDIQFSDGLANGAGGLYLQNTSNNFTGDIYMNGASGGILYAGKLNAGTGVPSTARLFLGATPGGGGYFDLNGNHVIIAGLETTAPGAIGGVKNSGSVNRTLTIDQVDTTVFGLVIEDGVNSSTIVGKKGTGVITFTGANTFTGGLTITGGTIQLGAANALAAGLPLEFDGGKFSTGLTTGYSQSLNTLQMTANGTILLGTTAHTLSFANSSAMSWNTAKTLTIANWTGTVGSSGTAGRIFVGTDATGLTAQQLSQISFSGYLPGATILSTGEIVPAPGYVWQGTTSTDWNTASNWSIGLVPSSTGNYVIIPSGTTYSPVISTATAYAGNIVINSGATVTISSGATLSVLDSLNGGTGSNAVITGAGVVVLNGTKIQHISGNLEISELNISDSLGVNLAVGASVLIDNAVDLNTGILNTTNGTLTLSSSSSSQAAIIDNFSAGNEGTITGNITAQRYYDYSGYSAARQQHEIGIPVTNVAFSQFGAGGTAGYVLPTTTCDELSVKANSPAGTVYSLHESNGATCGMAQWYVEPGTSIAQPGHGYSVILPSSGGPGTFSVTGAPNLDSSYTLTGITNSNWTNSTAEHHNLSSGWQLASNPYSATLQINTTNGGIDNQIQVWQANGPYVGTYQPGIVNSSAIIAPFQAFMVHVTTPGNTTNYTINASDRVRTAHTFFAANDNELDITTENLGTNLLDKTVVAFNKNATDTFDAGYDADKIFGSLNRHTLYTTNNGKWLGINVLHDVATTSTVPMGFEAGASGNYSMSFSGVNTFDPTVYITLEDKQLSTMYNLRNGAYNFSADSADAWARFVLHFTPPAVISTNNATCTNAGNISVTQPGIANWTYVLSDNNSNAIATGILNQDNSIFVNAVAGTYTLTLTDSNGYVATKVIQVDGVLPVTASFTASAATAQTPVSFTNTSQNANSFTWNFGDGSNSTAMNPAHTYSQPGTYTITMTANNTGCSAVYTESIIVTAAPSSVNTVTESGLNIWSNNNKVMVDFSQAGDVDALIKVYNILGQTISEEKFTSNALYQKEIDNVEAAYVIVFVNNNGQITTKKLLITNIGK
jgi:autotransporter-associated beta strand protein